MMKYWKVLTVVAMLTAGALAQASGDCPAPVPPRAGMHPGMMRGPGGIGPGPGLGKWWTNPMVAQQLGLTEAQGQQMEKAFQEHRAKLMELRNSLSGLESALEPMIAMNRLNEGQITSQIEKIAQARASLEKLNSMMLLDMRRVLSAEQWKQLQQQRIPRMPGGPGRRPQQQ